MIKNIVVDASVFISGFVDADAHNQHARSFFKTIHAKKIRITISVLTFFEILHAYFRATNNMDATDMLYKELIEWNIEKQLRILNIEASFLAYFGAHHDSINIKTSDAVVALTARRFKYPLITLDKKLLAVASPHINAMTPEKFLENL